MNLSYTTFKIVFNILFIILLSSCTSDSGSLGDTPKTNNLETSNNLENEDIVPVTIKGVFVDGYIKNAIVCVDINEDTQCTTGKCKQLQMIKGNFP